MGPRVTRKKAAEIAEQLHIDEDELLDLPSSELALSIANAEHGTPEPSDRPPLGEIAPNSAESNKSQSHDGAQELRKSTRNRKGKKGRAAEKATKTDFAASIATSQDLPNNNRSNEVLADANDSPASEKAAEDLMNVPERE